MSGKFMINQRAVALKVVVDDKARFEQFGMGYGPSDRWTSFGREPASPPPCWVRRSGMAISRASINR